MVLFHRLRQCPQTHQPLSPNISQGQRKLGLAHQMGRGSDGVHGQKIPHRDKGHSRCVGGVVDVAKLMGRPLTHGPQRVDVGLMHIGGRIDQPLLGAGIHILQRILKMPVEIGCGEGVDCGRELVAVAFMGATAT